MIASAMTLPVHIPSKIIQKQIVPLLLFLLNAARIKPSESNQSSQSHYVSFIRRVMGGMGRGPLVEIQILALKCKFGYMTSYPLR